MRDKTREIVRTSRSVDWKITIPRRLILDRGWQDVTRVVIMPKLILRHRLDVLVRPASEDRVKDRKTGLVTPVTVRPTGTTSRKITIPSVVIRLIGLEDVDWIEFEWDWTGRVPVLTIHRTGRQGMARADKTLSETQT